jgi:hypothetical protein
MRNILPAELNDHKTTLLVVLELFPSSSIALLRFVVFPEHTSVAQPTEVQAKSPFSWHFDSANE